MQTSVVSWAPGLDHAIAAAGWEARTSADPGEPPHLIRAKRGEERVDLIVALTDYQQEALARAQGNDHVLTVEDVIIHKTIAWRTRDRNDITSILHVEPPLLIDWDYVRHWVEYFGFESRLDELTRFS